MLARCGCAGMLWLCWHVVVVLACCGCAGTFWLCWHVLVGLARCGCAGMLWLCWHGLVGLAHSGWAGTLWLCWHALVVLAHWHQVQSSHVKDLLQERLSLLSPVVYVLDYWWDDAHSYILRHGNFTAFGEMCRTFDPSALTCLPQFAKPIVKV